VFTSTNSPIHKLGQGVIQDDPQTFLFNMGDMHRPSQKIGDDMEFQKGIHIFSLGNLRSFSFVWTFETNSF
jgi:hypothetical protein